MAENETKPAGSFGAVTPGDSTVLSPVARALFVGVGGDVALKAAGSTTAVTFKNVPDGAILPVKAEVVMATNTTATDIVALY